MVKARLECSNWRFTILKILDCQGTPLDVLVQIAGITCSSTPASCCGHEMLETVCEALDMLNMLESGHGPHPSIDFLSPMVFLVQISGACRVHVYPQAPGLATNARNAADGPKAKFSSKALSFKIRLSTSLCGSGLISNIPSIASNLSVAVWDRVW